MRKSPINKVSTKQAAELRERYRLKLLLLEQQQAMGYYHCQTCGCQTIFTGAGYLELSHIIALSRGGKTTLDNVILEGGSFTCGCHARYEKKAENRPKDSIGYKKWELLQ